MALTEESTFYILALCDYDPVHGGGPKVVESINEAPSPAFQLSFTRGQTFEVVGSDIINWWLYVKGVRGQDEGYIPSICFVPLRNDITSEEIQELVQGGTLLMSHVNTDVDLRFFPDAPNPKHMGTKRCPEETANILSKICFWWLNSLIMKGYRKPLETQDLWLLSDQNKSSKIVPKLQHEWKNEQAKSKKSKKHKVQTDTETEHLNMETEEVAVTVPNNTSDKDHYRPSLLKALVRVFLPFFTIGIFFKLVGDILIFVQPQLLKALIEHAEDKSSPEWKGYIYVLAMVLVAIVQYTFSQHSMHVIFVSGMRVGIAITGLVYSKSLQLCNSSRNCSTAGEILNLMSVDSQRLVQLVYSLNQVWSTPLQVCTAIYFLYVTMGASTLAGVAVLLMLIPLNILITRFQRRLQVKQLQYKDARVKLISEALSGVKVLKLYAWEESFMEKILEVRRQEVQYQKHSMYLTCTIFFFNSCAPMMVSLATFCVYTLSGNELTATKAFVAISLFNILRFPLSVFSRVVGNIIQAQVSLVRLNDFLNLEEKDPENVLHVMPEHVHAQTVHVENGTFSWEQNGQPVLENINLNITSGSLVAVVGQVGCGKSSLLSALLGETEKLDGMVYVKGTTAYVPQQAWIQNATVQDNVVFGKMMDTRRYKEVIRACALQPDLKVLPAGDLTEIGEKGINLSGGQKQRVSLARAVYFNADVYLLDDPLSAVDSHVGKHIFDKVLGPTGLIQDKTRILVTHSLQYLPHCDQIIVLQNGKISEIGTYNELVANQGAFAEFLNTYKNGNGDGKGSAGAAGKHATNAKGEKTLESSQAKPGANTLKLPGFKEVELSSRKVTSCHHLNNTSGSHDDIAQTNRSRAKSETNLTKNFTYTAPLLTPNKEKTQSPHHHSKASVPRMVLSMEDLVSFPGEADLASNVCDLVELESSEDDMVASAGAKKVEVKEEVEEEEGEEADDKSQLTKSSPRMCDEKKGSGRTTTVERAQTGRVKCSDVQVYSKAFGWVLFLAWGFIIFMSEAFIVSSGIWLADWSTANITNTNTRDTYVGVYGGLGLSQAVALLLGGFLLTNGATKASRGIHNNLLLNVLRSPMSFFETTPLGRIVNRFSRDVYMIDDGIPRSMMMFFRMCLRVIGTIFVISYSTPVFLACVVPLLGLYIFVQRIYIGSSRQLRRIESVSRSPVFSHFFETITGTNVIRAYAQQKRFLLDHHYNVDAAHMANYPYICSNRWLGLRLEFIGAFILLFAALFAVLYRDSLPAGLVGLSVAIALQITGVLTWMVRTSSDLETNLVAVERVEEYSQTPTEAPWIIPGYRPPAEWPQEGHIDVDGLGLRYRDGQPFVLHNISCQIDSGEKVGIVGRTGAGKSTLSMALFRILECNMGKIIIDNIDTSKIGLHDLRTRLTIIPQDPILFSGTIRMNLDPFNYHDDEELWRVLEVVHLKSYISGLQDGLQYNVQEGGGNLSVGQRQLVCLARALLRKSKILVLDEATASIDLETDELIQQTIRTEFADQTVLTIAHRLNTIMDYDRIMVLEHGSIVEFDTPTALLTRKKVFYDMAKDAGLTS